MRIKEMWKQFLKSFILCIKVTFLSCFRIGTVTSSTKSKYFKIYLLDYVIYEQYTKILSVIHYYCFQAFSQITVRFRWFDSHGCFWAVLTSLRKRDLYKNTGKYIWRVKYMKYMNFSSLNISEKVNKSYVKFLGTSNG